MSFSGGQRSVVMVDDNVGDLFIVGEAHRESTLSGEWVALNGSKDLKAYLGEVRGGVRDAPALMLVDLNMPTIDGTSLVEDLAADPLFSPTRFCVLTSSTDPRDRERALSSGAHRFCIKEDDLAGYIRFFNDFGG